jgi:hypothetical protein
MSIATYSELQTAVASELNRGDASAKVADWILMGESRLNRDLRMLDMVTTASGALSTASRMLTLPDLFQDKIQFRITDPLTELTWVPPERLMEYSCEESATAQPKRYTITDSIEFDRIPDTEYAYVFKYYKGYRLSAADDTNYLLTNYPQVYLFAACIYGAMFFRDFVYAHELDGLLRAEMIGVKRAEAKRKGTSAALLVTEMNAGQSYDIERD